MKEKTTITFKTIDEILDFAQKAEEEAYEFYTKWAKKIEKNPIKQVFEELASEELKHKAFIIDVKKGKSLTPSEEEIEDLKISDYLMDQKTSQDLDYQDALIIAMHKEKSAFRLYSHLAEISANEEMKSTFLALAQQEAKHKLKLETVYDEEILKEN
jgi:rubrerythrin